MDFSFILQSGTYQIFVIKEARGSNKSGGEELPGKKFWQTWDFTDKFVSIFD